MNHDIFHDAGKLIFFVPKFLLKIDDNIFEGMIGLFESVVQKKSKNEKDKGEEKKERNFIVKYVFCLHLRISGV